MLIFGCSSELPPEPGEIGTGQAYTSGSGKTGMAYYRTYEGYAPPVDVFDDDEQIYFMNPKIINVEETDSVFYIDVDVSHEDSYVYNRGYYYSSSLQQWIPFTFDQQTVSGSNWIKESASTSLQLNKNDFILGENYIVTYSCKKHNNEWKCGCSDSTTCNMWMLQNFIYRNVDLPPEPIAPGSIVTMRGWINPSMEYKLINEETRVGIHFDSRREDLGELGDSGSLKLTKPDGTIEYIEVTKERDIDCNQYEDRFNCYVGFYTQYTPDQSGEYIVEFGDDSIPEYMKVYGGSFKSVDTNFYSEYLILNDMGDYLLDMYHGYYWGDGYGFFVNYQRSDYRNINVNIRTTDQMWLDEDWEEVIVDGETLYYRLSTYRNSSWEYYKWLSGNIEVQVSSYIGEGETSIDMVPVIRAYLAKYPTGGYDLADYPKPFVKDNQMNGIFVVGSSAPVEDVIAITDIATSLQYSSSSGGSGGGSSRVSGEAYKFERSSNKFSLGESLDEIKAVIDEDELQTLLDDSTFIVGIDEEFEYEQRINMAQDLTLTNFSDLDYMDGEYTIGIEMERHSPVFDYVLDFKRDAVSSIGTNGEWSNFDGKDIEILGKKYSIIKTDNNLNKIEFMTDSVKDTIKVGDTKTYTIDGLEYDVQGSVNTGYGEATALMTINGELKQISNRGIAKFGDIYLFINEILLVNDGDIPYYVVEFYLGAKVVTLQSGSEVEVNYEEIDGLTANLSVNKVGNEVILQEIRIIWETDDEEFLATGEELVMPGLESVKLSMIEYYMDDEEGIVADVYIGEEYSSVVTVQRIEVGASYLDNEVADPYAQNVITVGNACVNSVSAEFLGNPADCDFGLEDGKGYLQIKNLQGQTQLIVNGKDPDYRRSAASVLANYGDYALAGECMEVTQVGTGLTVAECYDGPINESEEERICTDSDGGRDLLQKGTCTDNLGSNTDDCWSSDGNEGISEWYCHADDAVCVVDRSYPNSYCPNGCSDGRCVGNNSCIKNEDCSNLVGINPGCYHKTMECQDCGAGACEYNDLCYIAGDVNDLGETCENGDWVNGNANLMRITYDPEMQYLPDIYENVIIWSDQRETNSTVYMYNLNTKEETRVGTSNVLVPTTFYPKISGNRVVWYDNGQYASTIIVKDLQNNGVNTIMVYGGIENLEIDDNKIMWANSCRIYVYSFDNNSYWTVLDVCSFPNYRNLMEEQTDISGNKIVWAEYNSTDTPTTFNKVHIHLLDIVTGEDKIISTLENEGGIINLNIDGNLIVWNGNKNKTSSDYSNDIYLYDIGTDIERVISDNSAEQKKPRIYGSKIVWQDFRNGNSDIYVYDLSQEAEKQITSDPSAQYDPVIYDGKIVWSDHRTGKSDIYMYCLTGC